MGKSMREQHWKDQKGEMHIVQHRGEKGEPSHLRLKEMSSKKKSEMRRCCQGIRVRRQLNRSESDKEKTKARIRRGEPSGGKKVPCES